MSHEQHHHHSGGAHERRDGAQTASIDPSGLKTGAAAGVIYTCPMHPQIRQPVPGNCPICGMALEPLVATPEEAPSAELTDMTRRFWIGLALTIPVFVLEMGGHFLGLHRYVPPHVSNWAQLVLASPVVLWAGWPFFVRGAHSLLTRNLNMFRLIAMGTGVAWVYSVVATIAPSLFPPAFRNADGSVPIYFEAAAVITVLVLLGQVLELRAREQTGGAIRALLNLAPVTANRVKQDAWIGRGGFRPHHRLPLRPRPRDADVRHGGHRARRSIRRAHQKRRGSERFEKIDTLVVDKTGTLTEGRPRVTAIRPVAGLSENELLTIAASLERSSEHPLAQAIVEAALERALPLGEASDFDSPVGKGVRGHVGAQSVVIGNRRFLAEFGIEAGALDNDAERLREDGATAIYVALDGRAAGVIAIADPIKPTSPGALEALLEDGVTVVMLTGDNWTPTTASLDIFNVPSTNSSFETARRRIL